ncbi:hypothetical protein SBRCBS47491_002653 [Sporothrix bragantina]|uniref:Uncharacterized protein n=1 Tax=Sporothrix bragantina TaxID=671064 RepID=A0ABP0B8M5_9PEZI
MAAASVATRTATVLSLGEKSETTSAAVAATSILANALTQELAPSPSLSSRYIIASPYPDHLLDLETLEPQTQQLARALTVFDKVRDDYATAPYIESFNFSAVIDELRRLRSQSETPLAPWDRRDYFVVAFRSQIPPTTDYGDLSSLDKAAHREATDSGGLLRYWFHLPDANGRNLATCLWRTPADAHKAGHGAQHRKASGSVRSLYKEWRIERYRLVIGDDIESWEVVEWKD